MPLFEPHSLGTRLQMNRVTFSNVAYAASAASVVIAQVGTMSASRAVTLPSASSYGGGNVIIVVDESGTVTVTNTIVCTRSGSDTINGATTSTIVTAYGIRMLMSDGVSKWTIMSLL